LAVYSSLLRRSRVLEVDQQQRKPVRCELKASQIDSLPYFDESAARKLKTTIFFVATLIRKTTKKVFFVTKLIRKTNRKVYGSRIRMMLLHRLADSKSRQVSSGVLVCC